MPTRPTGPPTAMPVGEEVDAVGRDVAVLPTGAQVPDAVPVLPPPSKTEVNPVEGVVELVVDKCRSSVRRKRLPELNRQSRNRPLCRWSETSGRRAGRCAGRHELCGAEENPVDATGAAGPTPSGEVHAER